MRYHIDINYENDRAIRDNQDPREQLVELVTNAPRINRDQIMELAPSLSAHDQEDWLKEFVMTNNPYDVLQNCFYEDDLETIAGQQKVTTNVNDTMDDIVSKIVYKLGFKKRMEPIGLSQSLENLEQLQNDVNKMVENVDELLRNLFLFYSYTLRQYALEESNTVDASEEPESVEEGVEKVDLIITDKEKADPIGTIEKLLQDYRKTDSKSLGLLYQWLKKLMTLVKKNRQLTNYCQRHFQYEVPLNPSQIAEIGMFRTYRNLVGSGHLPDDTTWERHKNRSETDLDNMDDTTLPKWKEHWDYVVEQYDSNRPLPRREMLQRMRAFFKDFLNLLYENQIYPKVIVMREYKVDEYGTVEIFADSSDPDESVVLTDCDFKPFTECYYHSRTNPTGIEPILVPKKELEDWGTRQDNNTENQEEA